MPIASVAEIDSSVSSSERLRGSRNLGSATPKNRQMPNKARAMEESRMEIERDMICNAQFVYQIKSRLVTGNSCAKAGLFSFMVESFHRSIAHLSSVVVHGCRLTQWLVFASDCRPATWVGVSLLLLSISAEVFRWFSRESPD